jgi:ABC transporter substrate binding protein
VSHCHQRISAAHRFGLGRPLHRVEGRNVTIEFRWALGQYDRLPELAVELVRRRVAVIVAPGGMRAALAVKAATTTIPIVFGTGGDPERTGLVASLNRPGGNVTGVSAMNVELTTKRFARAAAGSRALCPEKADVARPAGDGGSNLAPVVASRPEAVNYATRSLGPGRSSSVRSRIWSRSPSSSTFLISSKASPSAALASSS